MSPRKFNFEQFEAEIVGLAEQKVTLTVDKLHLLCALINLRVGLEHPEQDTKGGTFILGLCFLDEALTVETFGPEIVHALREGIEKTFNGGAS